MRKKFRHIRDGEWFCPTIKHQMACCDCGLVHDVEFRIVMRAVRNEKATKAKRNAVG